MATRRASRTRRRALLRRYRKKRGIRVKPTNPKVLGGGKEGAMQRLGMTPFPGTWDVWGNYKPSK